MHLSKTGFTLIELLVAIAIMAVVMGTGAVMFTRFNQRQLTLAATREVHLFLKTAQNYARVKNVPPSSHCTTLNGYKVQFSSTALTMKADCTNDSSLDVASIDMPAALSAVTSSGDPSFTIRFLTLQKGAQISLNNVDYSAISGAAVITTVGRGSVTATFEVGSGGTLSEPTLQ